MKNYFLGFIIVSAALIQTSCLYQFSIFNIQFDLLFAITIFFGIKYGWYRGLVVGFWCGLLKDCFSLSTFGLHPLIYSLAGFSASTFENIIFTQHISTRLFILFILSILLSILKLLISNGFEIILKIWTDYKFLLLNIGIINLLFALPLYKLLDRISYEYRD